MQTTRRRMLARYWRYFHLLSRNARLYLLSNTIQAVSAGALAVLYTLYLQALGYSTAFIGLTLNVTAIGGGLGIIPASALVRRWGWRNTLIWSDVIGGVALAVQLIDPRPAVVLITAVAIGASLALLLVVNSPFLAASSGDEERTALFAVNNALAFLGLVAGFLLAGFLPVWLNSPAVREWGPLVALSPHLVPASHEARVYQLSLLITGALAIPSIVPVFYLRAEPWTAEPATPLLPRLTWPTAAQWRRIRTLAIGPVGRFATTQALIGFGAGMFGPYVNLYFVDVLGASTALYSVLASVLSVLLAVGSLLIVPLAARLGNIRAAVLVQVSSLPFLLLLGLAPTLLIASIAFLVRGPLMNAAGPPLQAFLMDVTTPDERVVASGVYNVSWQLASAIGVGVGGVLIARAGYPPVFVCAAVFYTISILLVAIWFARRTQQPTPASPESKPSPGAS
jgi:MFS family permease